MVLEATVICLDNSEWMRNGDFPPSRADAQNDACNLVCGTKLRSNPENSVAVLTMAKQREVLTTLTTDIGSILVKLHGVKIGGETDLIRGLQVAQLVLKHRQSKNHRQRIIAFVGSPLTCTEAELVKLAKKFKKNSVSVDIISFGEEDANQQLLEAFINTVNKDNTSHLVTIPSGGGMLSDTLISSPILSDGTGAAGGGAAGADGFEFGVDPSVDPELALALRISMEEERQRQKQLAESEGTDEASAQPMDTEGETEKQPEPAQAPSSSGGAGGEDVDYAMLSEEEQLAMAMRMSLEGAGAMDTAEEPSATEGRSAETTEAEAKEEDSAEQDAQPEFAQDLGYLQDVLSNLQGVDPNDPEIMAALSNLQGGGGDDASGDTESDKKKGEDKE